MVKREGPRARPSAPPRRRPAPGLTGRRRRPSRTAGGPEGRRPLGNAVPDGPGPRPNPQDGDPGSGRALEEGPGKDLWGRGRGLHPGIPEEDGLQAGHGALDAGASRRGPRHRRRRRHRLRHDLRLSAHRRGLGHRPRRGPRQVHEHRRVETEREAGDRLPDPGYPGLLSRLSDGPPHPGRAGRGPRDAGLHDPRGRGRQRLEQPVDRRLRQRRHPARLLPEGTPGRFHHQGDPAPENLRGCPEIPPGRPAGRAANVCPGRA